MTDRPLDPAAQAIADSLIAGDGTPGDYDPIRQPVSSVRPSWDEWGLGIAAAVATRADCVRQQVGAVIITDTDHRVIATGYNGAASEQPGCLTAGACPRGQRSRDEVPHGSSYDTGPGACIALHAEQNAIMRVAWTELAAGATIYVTHAPCDGCRRMILGAGLARVVYRGDGADTRAITETLRRG